MEGRDPELRPMRDSPYMLNNGRRSSYSDGFSQATDPRSAA